ncbi:plastocyanin/azurin family copper-binding protein [Halorarius halobius]|uniref:plastocyanin/azurin family copper-binding protein n=1 Tax=Halorarius halobius TaxID=2962671 RepID=UPI0020CC8DB1|nr:plastocyanin/azurin family copper-binding protein [Halorarius halobius]
MTRHTTRRDALAAITTAGTLALTGCIGGQDAGGGGNDDGDTPTPTSTSTSTSTPVEADATVTVGPGGDLTFAPSQLRVAVGATVAWRWDSGGHSLTVRRKPGESDWRGTNLSTKEAGYVLTETFEVAGRYDYYCTPHQGAGMSGTLFVGGESPTGTAPSAEEASATTTPTAESVDGGDPY